MSSLDTASNKTSPSAPYTASMSRFRAAFAAAAAVAALGAMAAAHAQQARVIVAFKADAATLREHPMSQQHSAGVAATLSQRRAERLAELAGVPLAGGRAFAERAQVVKGSGLTSQALARRLAAHPEVAYAVVDQRRRLAAVPNDPLFASGPASGQGPAAGQWYLRAPTATVPAAINAETAWDRITGAASVVVAVLDTGVLGDHADLAGAVLPGYDLIDDLVTANDGDLRDGNASDPGDWITAFEANNDPDFADCRAEDSSWHGTQVSGIIAGVANNGRGIAGAAHGVRILPVRVLGKCGGFDSDIVAGMYWAAGIDQPGLPGSATPARVLNLSLGGAGPCDQGRSTLYGRAIATLAARNVVVVASAGNSAGHAVGTPANCPGVIAVAALRHAGSKVGFSDIGPQVTISAPGGNCVNLGSGEPCLYPIATTSNSGAQSPLPGGSIYTDSFTHVTVGTSFSAPLVAASVALMVSARPQLTTSEITAALKLSARPFPTTGGDNGSDPTPVATCRAPDDTDQLQCYCSTGLCGAGMLDAQAAVQVVTMPGSREEAARQLMDFGERAYPQYFPNRLATQSSPPFLYRYHPGTGIYLGVVVQPGLGYALDGVYVQGGPFGPTPQYQGQLQSYITPQAAVAAAGVTLR